MIPATQLKIGMAVIYKGEPHRITSLHHVTPGNWRGMVHAKLVNIRSGSTYEYRFRSEEKVERAVLETHEMEFLYKSDSDYTFMNTESYEMVTLPDDALGDAVKYLLPNMKVRVQFYEGQAIGVELPLSVELKILETEPPLKGATASASPKAAKLENGIVIKVPQFLQIGDMVRVDTRDDSFIERA